MSPVSPYRPGRFERFCVVGLGNHALTKLIPAIIANGQALAGLVTRQSGGAPRAAPLFADIDMALAALPDDTVFVIASPPSRHFDQAMRVIEAGRDVIIDKPAFLTEHEAMEATGASVRQGGVLVEGFMHRHTALYRRFMAEWAAHGDGIEAIAVDFHVPAMPAGTFRQEAGIGSSGLYDIGCYPVSLLSDLGLPLADLALSGADFPGQTDREAVHLSGRLNGIGVNVRVGVGAAYANVVRLTTRFGEEIRFSQFFYGRAGERAISKAGRVETVHDADAFQAMFNVPRGVWLSDQIERNRGMVGIARNLERLGEELLKIRSSGGQGSGNRPPIP